MEVTFATKCISTAEKYINESDWQELKDNKEAVLEAVKKGLIRICDPLMYGDVKIASGDKWKGSYDEFKGFVYNKLLKSKRKEEE